MPALAHVEATDLLFVPLGGAGEIGLNANLYGYGDQWLMIDLGVTFGDDNHPGVDVLVPDLTFVEEHCQQLLGVVLTHAHEDHIGAIQYLWPDLRCPVYATAFTAALLRRKLEEEGLADEVPIHIVRTGERLALGPFEVEFIRVTHSIAEPSSLALRTPAGTILHSGDWKLDPEPLIGGATDEEALRRLGAEGVLAVVGDSTNAMVPGRSGSEAEVRRALIERVSEFDQRVVIATFASNVARLETIAHVAMETGRQAALVGRSYWRIYESAKEAGFLLDLPPFLTDREAAELPRRRVLLACTGSQAEPRAALTRIAAGTHPVITLDPGDAVFFSSRVIPGNEAAIYRLQNELTRHGAEVIVDRGDGIHVSGHPAQEELECLYQWVRPKICLPVHGEPRHQHAHANIAKSCQVPIAIEPLDGQVIRLAPGTPGLVGEVPVGKLALDGGDLLPLDSIVLRERQRVLFNGAATVTVVLDPADRLLGRPRLSLLGLVDPEEDADLIELFVAAVESAVDSLPGDARGDDATVAETARRALRRTVNRERGKKPVTQVQVVRL